MRALFAALLLLASGCGPVYHTDYKLIPPATESGKSCANECASAQLSCNQTCGLQTTQCTEAEERRARDDFDSYSMRQGREGRPAKLEISNFYYAQYCKPNRCEASCLSSYHQCHTKCGGSVVPQTTCTSNCD